MTAQQINKVIAIFERLQHNAPIIITGEDMTLLTMLIPELIMLGESKRLVSSGFSNYCNGKGIGASISTDHVTMCPCADRAKSECEKYCVNSITS